MSLLQLAFGYRADWVEMIAARLDKQRFRPAFAPLDRLDLDWFDAVLPLDLSHYAELARRPDLLGRKVVHPSARLADLCDDKLALARWLIKARFGAHVPAVFEDGPRYPLVRRPRRDEFGRGARILMHARDEPDPPGPPPGCFDQEFVTGIDEYSLHVLRVGGRVRFAWALHHVMAAPGLVRGGRNAPVNLREIDPRPALACFEPMLAALDYTGTCCIDFKLRGGRPMLLEINPRFGASLAFNINRYVTAYLGCLSP